MGATLSNSQIVCMNCEELVHRYAARCPYCNQDLTTVSLKEPVSCKITHLEQPIYVPQPVDESVRVRQDSLSKINITDTDRIENSLPEDAIEDDTSLLKVLLPLISLLAGSFFIFFSLMIKLFSKNGKLTLEWSAESWPYYLVPALILLVIGMATLSRAEKELPL
ncbi:MAG: hypothetical protein JWO53_1173 [Chlamydiia bacterium]|nr:hypothetical protein [Chlamydiia bacterium]